MLTIGLTVRFRRILRAEPCLRLILSTRPMFPWKLFSCWFISTPPSCCELLSLLPLSSSSPSFMKQEQFATSATALSRLPTIHPAVVMPPIQCRQCAVQVGTFAYRTDYASRLIKLSGASHVPSGTGTRVDVRKCVLMRYAAWSYHIMNRRPGLTMRSATFRGIRTS